jgi:hypothetical protein
MNFCDIDSHTQQINHIDRLTRENAELRDQLQNLVHAAYFPLNRNDFDPQHARHGYFLVRNKILKNAIEASEALLESI